MKSLHLLERLIGRLEANLGQNSTGEDSNVPYQLFGGLDIRVGEIMECCAHPSSELLYCVKANLGEETPREIVSALRASVPLAEMTSLVLVVANSKPKRLHGSLSCGMLLTVQLPSGSCKLLRPPHKSVLGERVSLEPTVPVLSYEEGPLEQCLSFLRSDSEGFVCFGARRLSSSQGYIQTGHFNSEFA